MATSWRYRVASVLGTASLAAFAVWFVNHPHLQQAFSHVPIVGRPAPNVLSNSELTIAVTTALIVTLVVMWPMFKPRPRRMLDTILLTQKRIVLAMVGLAALGYFDYNFRLPRATLLMATVLLVLWLPAWMVAIRRRPSEQSRAIIVGNDPFTMEAILEETDLLVIGYVSPPSSYKATEESGVGKLEISDGGAVTTRLYELSNLGGLSRLDEVLVKHEVDTALLAFADADRADFFGTLDTCYEHGVTAMVHRDHADDVLTAGVAGGELVAVDLDPWDWQDYLVKRIFDVCFSGGGLIVLLPLILVIAAAIKLRDSGPVLYSQERTAEFGDTFTVYKFRTMVAGDEDTIPGEEKHRVTRIGRFLRKTHLDEIPQLWSILIGDMSVVGPRAAWTGEEIHLEEEVSAWSQRWFVKPGLTGLAQINSVTSEEPREKLRYDIEYIRGQSLWLDLKIVVRQVWSVLLDFRRL